jgi:hypothetical protein
VVSVIAAEVGEERSGAVNRSCLVGAAGKQWLSFNARDHLGPLMEKR